jgi:hypothetical protein
MLQELEEHRERKDNVMQASCNIQAALITLRFIYFTHSAQLAWVLFLAVSSSVAGRLAQRFEV